MANCQKIDEKVQILLGEIWLTFALDPKCELETETLALHSDPKFMCLLVQLYKYFGLW